MRTDEGGGGYTNWSQWRVDQMAPVINGEDSEHIVKHSDAWFWMSLATATLYQRIKLRRDQLSEHWRGEAATAYFNELDKLLTALDETQLAAYNNHVAMNNMAGTIATAQEKMAPILATWHEYDRQEAEYNDNWVIYKMFVDDPVSQQEREALNNQARTVMYHASGGLFDSYRSLTTSNDFDLPAGSSDLSMPIAQGEDPDARSLGSAPVPPLRAQTPSPLISSSPSDGPLLSSGAPPHAPPPAPSHEPWTSPPEPNTGQPVVPPVIGAYPGGAPQGWRPGQSGLREMRARGMPGQSVDGNAPVGRPTALPSIIGGRPGVSPGTESVSRTSAGGGVIAGPGQRGGSPGLVGASMGGVPSRPRSRDGLNSSYDLDRPFDVDTSGAAPPVIRPDPEPDFSDPGPAIGLSR